MARLAITLACGDYDRTRALADGRVTVETASLPYVLPWVYQEIGRVRALMGGNYWSYGLTTANRIVLGTFLRYAREQGLAKDDIEPEDLFAPETRDALAI